MKERLKECRVKAGYTQKYIALTVGVAMPTVSQWESGIKSPSVENLIRLADLYGVTVDHLLGRDTPGSRPAAAISAPRVDPAEARLLAVYRSLNSQGKEYIRQQFAIAGQLYAGEPVSVPGVANQ
jgi:transcriptional regulator with XRE-family HTH domain